MPTFDFPAARRYNTLRLLGYDYNSTWQLCAISLVTDLRRPLFADTIMAKLVIACLLSEQTLEHMRVRGFTLMPDHLHMLAGVRDPEKKLPNIIGFFKSYTTQQYWKRCQQIVNGGKIVLPSSQVAKATVKESEPLITALMDWRASLRPEVVELKNWPKLKPEQFLKKRLWQTRIWDHVIRNDNDLQENLDYIAMNPVREGYVTHPQFYPYTGFLV
jgi:REP element-mobilizing transposase RayT